MVGDEDGMETGSDGGLPVWAAVAIPLGLAALFLVAVAAEVTW